jgi:hypothetical protein
MLREVIPPSPWVSHHHRFLRFPVFDLDFGGLRDSGCWGRCELIMRSGVDIALDVAAVGDRGTAIGVVTVSGSSSGVRLSGDLGRGGNIGACCLLVSTLLA